MVTGRNPLGGRGKPKYEEDNTMKNTNVYEDNGHFFFEDEQDCVEISEMVSVDSITWDVRDGYILSDGRNLRDIIIGA